MFIKIRVACSYSVLAIVFHIFFLMYNERIWSFIGKVCHFAAVTAILGVITAINEHIIDTAPSQIHTGHPEPSTFPYSLCISALKDLETLVEVVAQHYYGDTKKWNFIAATEAIK